MQPYGTSTAMTITVPGSGAARESTAIDNTTTKYDNVLVSVEFTAGTVTGNKQVIVYIYASEDGTTYSSVCTGTNAAITLRVPESLPRGVVIPVPTSSVSYEEVFDIASHYGGVIPRKWGIVYADDGAGTATGLSVSYSGITY